MASSWLKARIVVMEDDTGAPRILRDSGISNDTHVIAYVPSNTFSINNSSERVWQGCVSAATLLAVELCTSSELPVPSSPLESSGPLSLTNELCLYISKTVSKQLDLKHREGLWIQPMRSHPVEEVWLRPSPDCADEKLIGQFLDQVNDSSTRSVVIVKLDATLQFPLNTSSHDPKGQLVNKTTLWFDVIYVLPIAQGHLTSSSKIIIVPPDNAITHHRHSNSESDSDEGLTNDPNETLIRQCSNDSDDDYQDLDLTSFSPHPRQPIPSASQFRRSSVVTIGNSNVHIFKCIPLYEFPAEKNFILLPRHVMDQLGCYGLENLHISPIQYPGLHDNQGVSFVAVVEDYRVSHSSRNTVYIHPEVYYNMFPYPVDHTSTEHQIQAEVYRPGLTANDEPFVRYKSITVTPVTSRAFNNCTIPTDLLLRRYFKRDSEIFFSLNYVFSILSDCGVIYFKVVATNPVAPLGSVGLSTAVVLKTPSESSFIPDCDHLTITTTPYWRDHCPKGLYRYYQQLLSYCLPVYERLHPNQVCVLMNGPSGIGKATIAKAVARACRVHLIQFNCHDVGEHVPNILKRLWNAVSEAEHCAPSLLLLRKVHALCKEKDTSREDPRIAQWFDKLVKQLAQHNANSKYPVMMVATSYRPEVLPQRISGCFIHEVVMTSPNLQERVDILKGLSAHMTIAPDVDFTDISLRTSGMLLGDFVAMTAQASQLAMDEVIQYCYPKGVTESCDQLSLTIAGVVVTQQHYDQAVKTIQGAHNDAIGAPKVPTVTWKDVGGLQTAKDEILDTIQLPLLHPEMFSKGLRRSGILLYGAPGTGKTLIAKAVATECALNFLSVKGPELINMYVGQSEQNIREVFARAKTATPCVIFFDEIDSLAPNRGNNSDSGGVMDRIVSQLLAELDGLHSNEDVFVIGATNRPDLLDPSMLRPGRFDRLVFLDIADDITSKVSILQALTRGIHLHDDVSLDSIAISCPSNTTGADLYALCNEATKVSLRRTINNLEANGLSDDDWTPPLLVTNSDFHEAIKELKPSVSLAELDEYRSLHKKIKRLSDDDRSPPLLVTDNDFNEDIKELKSSVSLSGYDEYRSLHEKMELKPSVSLAELDEYRSLHKK